MKITRIETIGLSFPHPEGHRWVKGEISSVGWDQVVVRIHTDEGISGIGEADGATAHISSQSNVRVRRIVNRPG